MIEDKLTKVYIALHDLYETPGATGSEVQDALQLVHEKVEGLIERIGDQLCSDDNNMEEDVEDSFA